MWDRGREVGRCLTGREGGSADWAFTTTGWGRGGPVDVSGAGDERPGGSLPFRDVRDLEAVADAAEAIVNETGIGMYRAANGAGWRRLQEALWTIRGTWPE